MRAISGPRGPRTRRCHAAGVTSAASHPSGHAPSGIGTVSRNTMWTLRAARRRTSSTAAGVDSAAGEATEKVERRRGAHIAVEAQFTWQVADVRARIEAVRLAVCTEHRRAAARGTHQIEQHADRRRLAGAIQAEESEDL